MKNKNVKTKEKFRDVEHALKTFEEYAVIQAKTYETGNYRLGNKCHNLIMRALVYLYEMGCVNCLEPYLSHSEAGVRLEAAFALLPFLGEKSESVLEDLAANSGGIMGINAQTCLSRWKSNEIIFPYEDGWHW